MRYPAQSNPESALVQLPHFEPPGMHQRRTCNGVNTVHPSGSASRPYSVSERRQAASQARARSTSPDSIPARSTLLRPELLESWQRVDGLCVNSPSAPLIVEADCAELWQRSIIRQYCSEQLSMLSDAAHENRMVAVVADEQGRILWQDGARQARRSAEQVNFAPAGCWGESAMGTNALSLTLATGCTTDVIAEEHTMQCVNGWVCHAAPLIDPRNGRSLGVIDLSACCSRFNRMTTAFVASVAHSIAQQIRQAPTEDRLTLTLLGTPSAYRGGRRLKLTRRQLEILALLALHPKGMTGETMLHALHGDRLRRPGTLKAEISHLRKLLDGHIDNRPYRLSLPIDTDFLDCWQRLQGPEPVSALSRVKGTFFAQTESPALIHWRHCFEAALQTATADCKNPALLNRFIASNPEQADAMYG